MISAFRRASARRSRCEGSSSRALFAEKRLGQVTPWVVDQYNQERATKARVRVNRELAVLKAMFNRMREWGKYEGPNPVAGIDFLKEPWTRLRYLEPEEESALLAATGEPLRSVILVGIHAGLRIKAEAMALRWQDIDLKRGFLTVQAAYANSGICRSDPLNSVLREALANLKKTATGENVIMARSGKPLGSIRETLETACSKRSSRA
jgi:integrase